jgi:hypothetical protein
MNPEEMIFLNEYDKNEFYGREMLKDFIKSYPTVFKYEMHYMPNQYDSYDAYYFVIKEDQQIKKRVWIEIKIRTSVYQNYILEAKKIKGLIKKRNELFLTEDEVAFLYINFTPEGTFIWNITNIEENNKSEKLTCNKQTAESRDIKTTKSVYYMEKDKANFFPYRLDYDRINKNYKKNYLYPIIEKKIKEKGLDSFFDKIMNDK